MHTQEKRSEISERVKQISELLKTQSESTLEEVEDFIDYLVHREKK